MWAPIFNAACNLFFWLAVRFGSKGWGGVDGAYRHFRALRQQEFEVYRKANDKAVASRKWGDLDDSALAALKANQRYEIEEYHVESQLQTALGFLDMDNADDVETAKRLLAQVLYILRNGRPERQL